MQLYGSSLALLLINLSLEHFYLFLILKTLGIDEILNFGSLALFIDSKYFVLNNFV